MSQQRRTYNQRQALSRYEERRRQEEARREMLQRRREKEQESRELAKGPIDLPFCLLVLLLTAVGLVMLLSASFPSAFSFFIASNARSIRQTNLSSRSLYKILKLSR